MSCDRNFLNIILVGLGFMFVFTAFQTMGNIEKTVLNSISTEDPNFTGDGYVSLAVIYTSFAISNWLVPSVISVFGPKVAMVYGGVTYLLFIMTFLWPHTWLLYLASVIMGTGAAMIWTGQGNYLTLNSTPATISRNSGVFWALLQFSLFLGNLFVFFKFQGLSHIDLNTRTFVMWMLSGVCLVGIIFLLTLPKPHREDDIPLPENLGPVETLKGAIKLFTTKHMLLLNITFLYTGFELSFFSGVYSSSVGFTKQLGENSKQLVGLSGVCIGIGEVIGGSLFGILGSRFRKWGRDPIVAGGFVVHLITFFLIFLNLPDSAPFKDTDDKAFITSSSALALLCALLLGFGDACFNTQIFSMLGSVYSKDSSSAFAIFKFSQSIAAAITFYYSSHIGLYAQLGILAVSAVFGTITFIKVEWAVKKVIEEVKVTPDVNEPICD